MASSSNFLFAISAAFAAAFSKAFANSSLVFSGSFDSEARGFANEFPSYSDSYPIPLSYFFSEPFADFKPIGFVDLPFEALGSDLNLS